MKTLRFERGFTPGAVTVLTPDSETLGNIRRLSEHLDVPRFHASFYGMSADDLRQIAAFMDKAKKKAGKK